MDGEDMLVNLPYVEIRTAVAVHVKALDEIREAKLVILDLGKPENVLMERRSNVVTGILGFGQALWGDVDFGDPRCCDGVRKLL